MHTFTWNARVNKGRSGGFEGTVYLREDITLSWADLEYGVEKKRRSYDYGFGDSGHWLEKREGSDGWEPQEIDIYSADEPRTKVHLGTFGSL